MAASEAMARCTLSAADVAGGLARSDVAGWNQTADDWALFIARGHVPGRRDARGEIIATAAALPYDEAQGWISMVLVAPAWRHRGLATALMGDCMARLRGAGINPVLDATPDGEPVYRRLGFVAGFGFERWQGVLPAPRADAPPTRGGVREATAADVDTIAALDAAGSGIGRRFLIESFLARPTTRAWIRSDGSGFVIARAGRRATQIGPLIADDESAAGGLLDAALRACSEAVFLDLPTRWTVLADTLQQRGFSRQRPFVRMALGAAPSLAGSERQFLVAGPEFG